MLGLGFMNSPIIVDTCEAILTLKSVGRVVSMMNTCEQIFQAFDGDGYGAAASWTQPPPSSMPGSFVISKCHVAIVAALLVGNWTSLPSKLFAQKNWWKFWTHTHTQIEHFLPCLVFGVSNWIQIFLAAQGLEMGKFLHWYQVNFISFYKREREGGRERKGGKEGGSEGMERYTTTY